MKDYRVLLLDMNSTFMFGEDRFGPEDDFGVTYRWVGGRALSGDDVHRAIRATFEILDARYADPRFEDDFPSLAEALETVVPDLPLDERRLLAETFARHEIGVVPEEFVFALRRLHETHELRLITNIWSPKAMWERELSRIGVLPLFRRAVFSSDTRSVKPSLELTRSALEGVDDLQQVLMVGDSVPRDLEAARRAGIAMALIADETHRSALSGRVECCIPSLLSLGDAEAPLPSPHLRAMSSERMRPALYLVHREPPRVVHVPPDGYEIVAVRSEDIDRARPLVELDGRLENAQWSDFVQHVVPDGLFVAVHRESGTWVGTASASHNPQGSRFHFPGGGAIGYVVVHEEHRGRGLGAALVDAVLTRLREASYRNIWVGVEGHRLPAIRTYLSAGFVPFLHPPNPDGLELRWRAVFAALGRPTDSSAWPRALEAP